jgi:hypothetical protein
LTQGQAVSVNKLLERNTPKVQFYFFFVTLDFLDADLLRDLTATFLDLAMPQLMFVASSTQLLISENRK